METRPPCIACEVRAERAHLAALGVKRLRDEESIRLVREKPVDCSLRRLTLARGFPAALEDVGAMVQRRGRSLGRRQARDCLSSWPAPSVLWVEPRDEVLFGSYDNTSLGLGNQAESPNLQRPLSENHALPALGVAEEGGGGRTRHRPPDTDDGRAIYVERFSLLRRNAGTRILAGRN